MIWISKVYNYKHWLIDMVYITDPENCCRARGKSLGTRVMAKPWVSWVWRDTLVFVARRLRVGRDYHVRIYKAATGLAPVYRIKHNQTIIQAMVLYSHQFMLQSLAFGLCLSLRMAFQFKVQTSHLCCFWKGTKLQMGTKESDQFSIPVWCGAKATHAVWAVSNHQCDTWSWWWW